MVRLTRDGGRTWSDVTPKGVPHWAKVATIEPSPTTPGTAYAAVDNHRQDDFRPYVFRTRDYGRSWTLVTDGLPADRFVGVVRPDTVRAGLLYAGTDEGVYVSFDDGGRWQSLQRNLPVAWVRDIAVHDDDLIVATQGRAIWVLDDLSPLRQHDAAAGASAYLYTPSTAIRVRKNQNHDTPLPKEVPAGTNPPTGAVIDYWLASPAQRVELEVRDASDNVVRRWASDEPAPKLTAERYFAAAWLEPARSLPADAGMHRWVWDLRLPRPHTTEYEYSLATAWGQGVPMTPGGPVAAPGKYRVVLRVDGAEQSAPLTVAPDPRVPVDPGALASTLSLYREVAAQLERQYAAAAQTEWLMERLGEIEESAPGNPRVRKAVDIFATKLEPLAVGSGDLPDNMNLSSIGGTLRSLASDLETTDRAPTAPQHRVLAETTARLDRALARWNELRGGPLDTLNASLAEAGVPAIDIPPPDRITLKGPSVSREIP